MKSHAVVTNAVKPLRRWGTNARPGRVRLVVALLILAAPLAVAVWGLGGYSAQRERNNADTGLAQSLNAAGGVYDRALSDVDAAATKMANNRRRQLELLRSRSHILVWRMKLDQAHPGGELTRWRGSIPAAAAVRKVTVLSKGRTAGKVVVFLPLDRRFADWLTRRVALGDHEQLGLADGDTLVGAGRTSRIESGAPASSASDIRAGGRGYRAVAQDLGADASHALLVALEPASFIDSKASSARWRVMGPGFALIAALLAMAYAVSPSIARSRLSRQEREQAERVLAHVGDGVFLVDHDGVIRLWNPAAEAITGLRSDAIRNRPAEEIIPGWPAIAARLPVARRPGDADDASSAETVPLEIDGREVWLSIVGVTLADGIVYAFRDVTRERRLEELRAQFVATISHELRTPLASLHGAA
ncbi:MAG: PAS domain S-box protein, partial [Gaiellaceae bacterium]